MQYNDEVLWVVGFMIQKANERFIKFNEYKEWHSFEDPDTVLFDEYDRVVYYMYGRERHEIVTFHTVESKLTKAIIHSLNSLYRQELMTVDFLEKVLEDYAKTYIVEHTSEPISITGKQSQGVKLWLTARKLMAEKEKELIWKNICRGYGKYELAVLDLTAKKEYPVRLAEHWSKMAEIIEQHYQEEFKTIHDQNNIELENKWIYEHFKFLGKGTGYETFRESDSDLYGAKAAGKRYGSSFGRWKNDRT